MSVHLWIQFTYVSAEFRWPGSAPPAEFLSIYCQISSLQLSVEKVGFCGKTGSWWLGGINFPFGAQEAGSCFTVSPSRCSSIFASSALRQLWKCGAFSETKGIRRASPLFPSLQEPEQSKSPTTDKILVGSDSFYDSKTQIGKGRKHHDSKSPGSFLSND